MPAHEVGAQQQRGVGSRSRCESRCKKAPHRVEKWCERGPCGPCGPCLQTTWPPHRERQGDFRRTGNGVPPSQVVVKRRTVKGDTRGEDAAGCRATLQNLTSAAEEKCTQGPQGRRPRPPRGRGAREAEAPKMPRRPGLAEGRGTQVVRRPQVPRVQKASGFGVQSLGRTIGNAIGVLSFKGGVPCAQGFSIKPHR